MGPAVRGYRRGAVQRGPVAVEDERHQAGRAAVPGSDQGHALAIRLARSWPGRCGRPPGPAAGPWRSSARGWPCRLGSAHAGRCSCRRRRRCPRKYRGRRPCRPADSLRSPPSTRCAWVFPSATVRVQTLSYHEREFFRNIWSAVIYYRYGNRLRPVASGQAADYSRNLSGNHFRHNKLPNLPGCRIYSKCCFPARLYPSPQGEPAMNRFLAVWLGRRRPAAGLPGR